MQSSTEAQSLELRAFVGASVESSTEGSGVPLDDTLHVGPFFAAPCTIAPVGGAVVHAECGTLELSPMLGWSAYTTCCTSCSSVVPAAARSSSLLGCAGRRAVYSCNHTLDVCFDSTHICKHAARRSGIELDVTISQRTAYLLNICS